MILISQAQNFVVAIISYLINLLFRTGDANCKTLRLKAYSDTLKKYLSVYWTTLWSSFLLRCFEKLESIAYISKWDPKVFRWSIATPVDYVLAFTPEMVLPEKTLNLIFIL